MSSERVDRGGHRAGRSIRGETEAGNADLPTSREEPEMDEPTAPVKRPLSEAELAARRANAQKSTGPTTEQGKSICRWNALRHGHRAELPVLPGECPEAYARRLDQWMDDLGAENETQRFFVERAVKASWKME